MRKPITSLRQGTHQQSFIESRLGNQLPRHWSGFAPLSLARNPRQPSLRSGSLGLHDRSPLGLINIANIGLPREYQHQGSPNSEVVRPRPVRPPHRDPADHTQNTHDPVV